MRGIGRGTAAVVATVAAMAVSAAPASASKITYGMAPQATLGAGDYTLMKQARVKLIRHGLGWDGIQPNATPCTAAGGGCNWGFHDAQIGAAAANGMRILPILYGAAPFVKPNPQSPPDNNIAAWKQYVRSAVERYGPNGYYWRNVYQGQFPGRSPKPVRDWQVWNEQTSMQFFQPRPNTKKYVKLLVAASQEIRAADRRANIMLGGVFGDTGPKGTKLAKFFKDLYKTKGIQKRFDSVAIHPYAANAKALLRQVAAIRKATIKGKHRKAKVWVTELGYTSGKQPKGKPVTKGSQKGQAKALTQAYRALKKNRKRFNLAGVIWFSWQDVNDPSTCKFCQRAGLVDVNGKPKLSYKAYKKVAR